MGTLHTIREDYFKDGSLYAWAVIYFQDTDNPLALESGSVGTWAGTYGSTIIKCSYTIVLHREVGFVQQVQEDMH